MPSTISCVSPLRVGFRGRQPRPPLFCGGSWLGSFYCGARCGLSSAKAVASAHCVRAAIRRHRARGRMLDVASAVCPLIQDLYPELAEAVRLKPICFASRPLKWLHTRVTRAARVVVTISPDQQRALESRHAKVTQVLPNWAPISSTEACELAAAPGEFPLECTRLIVHYAGNLGLACDLTTLGGALEILQHSGQLDSFSIVIRGEGIKVHQAQDLAHRYPQAASQEALSQSGRA